MDTLQHSQAKHLSCSAEPHPSSIHPTVIQLYNALSVQIMLVSLYTLHTMVLIFIVLFIGLLANLSHPLPVSKPTANAEPIPRPISFSKLATIVPLASTISALYNELRPKGTWLQTSWVETHLVRNHA